MVKNHRGTENLLYRESTERQNNGNCRREMWIQPLFGDEVTGKEQKEMAGAMGLSQSLDSMENKK